MPDRKSPSGLMAATVHPLDKGIGGLDAPCAPEEVAARGWNLFEEDLSLPTAVLSTGLMVIAMLSISSGLVLDTVTRGRREMKLLAYLSQPPVGKR